MGYYDKGTYSRGNYDPLAERESARDRYLDLIAKQRMGDQAMTNRMEAQAQRERVRVAEEERAASGQRAGDMAARGGQMGYSMSGGNPIAAVIGTVVGKGAGAVQHGQKYGAWEGVKAALNPFSTPKAMLGFGGEGAQGAGAGVAGQVTKQRQDYEKEKKQRELLAGRMEAQGRFDNESYPEGSDPEINKGLAASAAQPDDYGDLEASSSELTDEEVWQKYYANRK